MHYVATLIPNAPGYDVIFADLPGCVSHGDSLDDALRMAAEALSLHVGSMIADGDAIPRPSDIDGARDILRRWHEEDGYDEEPGTLYVPIHFEVEPGEDNAPPVRFTVSMRPDVVRRVDRLAGELGISRSAVLTLAAREWCVRMEEAWLPRFPDEPGE